MVSRALLTLALTLSGALNTAQAGYSIHYSADTQRLAPLAVTFEAQVPGGAQVTWEFGDGTTAQGTRPTHTYYRPGTYQVNVHIQDGTRSSRGIINVTVRDGGPERAAITLLLGGNSLTFSAQGSRVYAPLAPRWTLDGQPARGGAVLRDGPHVLRLELPGEHGVLQQEVRFNTGALSSSSTFESEVLRLTNDARARGWDCALQRFGGPPRPPVTRNAQLDVAARAQSSAMALHGYFDHVSPVDGSDAGRRARAAGYAWSGVAENIAGGQLSPQEVVLGWLKSPGHCKNIMSDYPEIGVSYVSRPGSELRTYWTQVFGRR